MVKNGFKLAVLAAALMLIVAALPANAQGDMGAPSVEVSDQLSLDGTVTVTSAYSEGPGFIVIHADTGADIGYRGINAGWNYNIQVPIDSTLATPTLSAMLHADTGTVGTYEFGTVEGADGPVAVNGAIVNPTFNVSVLSVPDQSIADNAVSIPSVTVAQRSWVVIHSGDAEKPGPVLGQTLVNAGTTANVQVFLSGGATTVTQTSASG